jgi:DNA-binding response OmpR family regulator
MSAKFLMVIDDSPTICMILESALGRQGYQVRSFPEPLLALRAIFVTGEIPVPDLLFVNLILPRMNGFQVIQLLRRHPQSKHIPIIVITRRNGLMDRLKAQLVGANEYVTKPFKIQDIVELARRYTQST